MTDSYRRVRTTAVPGDKVIDQPLERFGPAFWVAGIFLFEVATWLGDRLSFPGDNAIQLVLVFAYLALGVRLHERHRLDAARLALILAGLLGGFSLDRWLVDTIPWLHRGNAPWTADEYVGRMVAQVLAAALHIGPATALLLWSGLKREDVGLRFGSTARLFGSTPARLTALGLALTVAGILIFRWPGIVALPGTPAALVAMAAVYALANAIGAEVLYRGILLSALKPVLGPGAANWVQAIAYGVGFGLYTGLALGLPGLAITAGAVLVSYVFGRVALVTGGVGLLIVIHAIATFLTETQLL